MTCTYAGNDAKPFLDYIQWLRGGRTAPMTEELEAVHAHLAECAECRQRLFSKMADAFDSVNYGEDLAYLLEITDALGDATVLFE